METTDQTQTVSFDVGGIFMSFDSLMSFDPLASHDERQFMALIVLM